jgi:quinoprotein glucose dehydrogenase
MKTHRFVAAMVVAGATALSAQQTGAPAARTVRGGVQTEWRSYSADPGSTKYAPIDQINPSNVARLTIAWRRPSVDASLRTLDPKLTFSNNFRATPLMIGGVLYSPNGVGLVEAFDAATGRTIWVQQPPGGAAGLKGDSTRGLAYWRSGSDERLFVQRGETLMALDPKTGRLVSTFGSAGGVNLRYGPGAERFNWSGAPQVCRDVVIIGSSMSDSPPNKEGTPGDVRGYDARTGRLRWTFHVIPRDGEFGVDTWKQGSWKYTGHANLWSLVSVDEQLGYAYLPLTSPTSDMYGGHRLGDNLFSSTLVAVGCADGTRIWHQQLVRHDLWDYDLPAAPVLADITVDGRRIRAVVQITKQAFAFVFDRVTGQSVWPIEERAVPASTTPGEETAPTQPFPTRPPAFDRQGVTVDDLIDFTPELRAAALAVVKNYVIGPMFTPPSLKTADGTKGTIQLPGSVGGADWQGAAFDPATGLLYVPSITAPFVADLVPGNPKETNLAFTRGTREFPPAVMGLPLLRPPYGRITAIDLNRGEIAWSVPNGNGPRDHPLLRHLNLPPLGNPGRSAPVVTRTLLFVGEGDPIMVARQRVPPGMPLALAPSAGDRKFRAYDKSSGKVLWETDLPAGTTGAPMTYLHNGKQYVVVAIGSTEHAAEFVAFSLP